MCSVEIANAYGACSTLIMRDLGSAYYTSRANVEKNLFKFFNDDSKKVLHLSSNYRPSSFSFMMASTVQGQEHVVNLFEDLKAMSTEPVYNAKNETSPRLHVVPIPVLRSYLASLKDYGALDGLKDCEGRWPLSNPPFPTPTA